VQIVGAGTPKSTHKQSVRKRDYRVKINCKFRRIAMNYREYMAHRPRLVRGCIKELIASDAFSRFEPPAELMFEVVDKNQRAKKKPGKLVNSGDIQKFRDLKN